MFDFQVIACLTPLVSEFMAIQNEDDRELALGMYWNCEFRCNGSFAEIFLFLF